MNMNEYELWMSSLSTENEILNMAQSVKLNDVKEVFFLHELIHGMSA